MITDGRSHVLQLRAAYGEGSWGLPGGALEPGETVLDALRRECREELGCDIDVLFLSGVYYHARDNSHALIFRCRLPEGAVPRLSSEHVEWRHCAPSAAGGAPPPSTNRSASR